MASTIIGQVVELEGSVLLKGLDGITRIASVGSPVHQGDVLVTGEGARVIIDFLSGKRLDLAL